MRLAPPPAADQAVRRLDPLLRPRSVVVVGASPNPSFVSMVLKNLLRCGFAGPVAAVNPKYDCILDAPCYPSILDVPPPIDLVVVGVGWRLLPGLLDHCAQKQVGALDIITSGFAEVGPAGAQRQAELADWAQRTGIPVGGPNCLGLMHAPSGLVALPTSFERVVPGGVGLVLQSGMMAPSVLVPLFARNIGVSFGITSGNEADIDLADYLRYLALDDDTRVIGCFAEQIKRPEAFIAACQLAAEQAKPIVMLKIGRSEGGQRAALAHTGALVGSDDVIDTVLRKLGVTRVASLDELFEALAAFHAPRLPRGPGVAAVSVSGGAAGLLSDLAEDCGVTFTPLPEETVRQLKAVVPEFGNVGNPLDITGQGVFQADILGQSLELLAETPGIDLIVYGRAFPSRLDAQSPTYQALAGAIERHPETLFVAMALAGGHMLPGQAADTPVVEPLDRLGGVPFLQGAEYGLKAIAALARYAAFQRDRHLSPSGERHVRPEVADAARAALHQAAGRTMLQSAGMAILREYGIPTPRQRFARTLEQALDAAEIVGYPVALKVEAPGLVHKTRAGAVALGIDSPTALAVAFDRVVANARRAAGQPDGVLVQEMVTSGRAEVIVGMTRDPQFGPVIACGLGGVFVEVLRDVQLLLPPISQREVRDALARLRGAAVLDGADLAALVEVLVRFSELCQDLQDGLRAIDVNPLIVRDAGQGVAAVDCLIVPESAHATP